MIILSVRKSFSIDWLTSSSGLRVFCFDWGLPVAPGLWEAGTRLCEDDLGPDVTSSPEVSTVSPLRCPGRVFPSEGFWSDPGHHFNVFIWWPMLQIKILSDLRGELYTSRNDCIIQMQPRRWRMGGESMCSGCQSVCPVSVASVSLSLDTSRSVCPIIITILSLRQNKQEKNYLEMNLWKYFYPTQAFFKIKDIVKLLICHTNN